MTSTGNLHSATICALCDSKYLHNKTLIQLMDAETRKTLPTYTLRQSAPSAIQEFLETRLCERMSPPHTPTLDSRYSGFYPKSK